MNKPFLFSGRIQNCYDSHVHWRATGSFARLLDLKNIRSETDIAKLKIEDKNYKGDWLLGYGWDQNQFTDKKFPKRASLDQVFKDKPVYFRRIDGHAAWVNTAALKRAGLFQKNIKPPYGGLIELDNEGWPTGILVDNALNLITSQIPAAKIEEQKSDLLAAQDVFHRAGFTHIRDLTCDADQWLAALQLEKQNKLQLAVEQFFSADDPKVFNDRVELACQAKKESHDLLRPMGVKVFFDGALGSEGAWISRPYNSGSGQGLQLISDSDLSDMIRICSERQIDLAVHTIGDEAAHQVVSTAYELKKNNIECNLHLEHVELLRPETIQKLKFLNVKCHIQPSHWLSDKKWLKDKIGELTNFAFRWRDLELNKIHFDFGSDSPIEPTSFQKTFEAITDAQKYDIPLLEQPWWRGHEHSDLSWTHQTYTEFFEGSPATIYFQGRMIKSPRVM